MMQLNKKKGFLGPVGLLFLGSLLLFGAVMPGNHSEAEDAFEYSRLIEEGHGAGQFHPHHLLYIPMQKAVFKTTCMLGYNGRSYYVARAVSMVAGSAALCLFYLIAVRMQRLTETFHDKKIPLFATLGLLFSYGFLRYACEVEVYIPASAMMLAGFYCALRDDKPWLVFSLSVLFSASAILMHAINTVAGLIVIPLIYVVSMRRWKHALVHGFATLVIVGVVYWLVQNVWGTFKPATDTASEGWLRPGAFVKAVVGFGQCLLSANFLFTYQPVCEKLQSLFPYRMFAEEMFTGACLPTWLRVIAPVTFVLALVLLIFFAFRLLMLLIRRRRISGTVACIVVWVAGAALPTLVLEPSNPELWIMAMVPLWMLCTLLVMQMSSAIVAKRLLMLAVLFLGIHNIVAGMGSIKARGGDYVFKKSEWLLQAAGPNDVINTADSFVFTFYLNYWSRAEIRNVNTQDWNAGNTTFVLDDVFNPPAAIGIRYPGQAKRVAGTAAELRPYCRKIHDDQFGGVWIVDEGRME